MRPRAIQILPSPRILAMGRSMEGCIWGELPRLGRATNVCHYMDSFIYHLMYYVGTREVLMVVWLLYRLILLSKY